MENVDSCSMIVVPDTLFLLRTITRKFISASKRHCCHPVDILSKQNKDCYQL